MASLQVNEVCTPAGSQRGFACIALREARASMRAERARTTVP
jgi:hypothetical protein